VNCSSFQTVSFGRKHPGTFRNLWRETQSCPHPHTREQGLHQQMYFRIQ
jgi:hypothetical protein